MMADLIQRLEEEQRGGGDELSLLTHGTAIPLLLVAAKLFLKIFESVPYTQAITMTISSIVELERGGELS